MNYYAMPKRKNLPFHPDPVFPRAVIHKPYQMPTLMHVLKDELKLEINPN